MILNCPLGVTVCGLRWTGELSRLYPAFAQQLLGRLERCHVSDQEDVSIEK